jgi:hypothetical protein
MYEKPAAGKIGTSVKVCNLDSGSKRCSKSSKHSFEGIFELTIFVTIESLIEKMHLSLTITTI